MKEHFSIEGPKIDRLEQIFPILDSLHNRDGFVSDKTVISLFDSTGKYY